MNGVLKEKIMALRHKMNDTDNELNILKETIKLQTSHISELKKIDSTQEEKRTNEISAINDEISVLVGSNLDLQHEYDLNYKTTVEDHEKASSNKTSYTVEISNLKRNMDDVVKESKFYEKNDHCPTCSQDISAKLKTSKNEECQNKAKSLNLQYVNTKEQLKVSGSEVDKLYTQIVHLNEVNNSIRQNETRINILKNRVEALSQNADVQDTTEAETKLSVDKEKSLKLLELRFEQTTLTSYFDAIGELLRDTGIKTKVIRQYLPIMNKLINQYLQVLDFFVLFHLDDSFNETIKSRHRDEFTYSSFSEGEKQRIDLSLLFSWRKIARMKNSANTNLLILDETFDSSMDADGVDNLLKILNTLGKETNVFIISHKQDLLEGKFPKKIEFEKIKNFSQVKKIKE
jgi:hypothetical protein